MALAFDILLASILIVLAWTLLRCRDLFQAVVLFISFGFLLALAWVRLNAPDIALAEAAIGSAMTGALLLATLREFTPERHKSPIATAAIAGLLCLAIAGLLGYAVLDQPDPNTGLREAATLNLASTGVSNPVTAVLLSFRAYDTFLEIGVLLMAGLAVLSIQNTRPALSQSPSRNPVLTAGVRILLPLLILVAGYLLWVGAYEPGGAFQAGSVLAGAMILAALTDPSWMNHLTDTAWRIALVLGLAVFLLAGAGTALASGSLLEYRNGLSKWLILAIETAATLSIAFTLTILLAGKMTSEPGTEDSQ